jgi:hypothetical protein
MKYIEVIKVYLFIHVVYWDMGGLAYISVLDNKEP